MKENCKSFCPNYPNCQCGGRDKLRPKVFPNVNEINPEDFEGNGVLIFGVDFGSGDDGQSVCLIHNNKVIMYSENLDGFNSDSLKVQCFDCLETLDNCLCNDHLTNKKGQPIKARGWLESVENLRASKAGVDDWVEQSKKLLIIEEARQISRENRCSGCSEEHVNCKCNKY